MKWRQAGVATSWVAVLLVPTHRVRAQLFAGETAEEACPLSFAYENPLCVNNGTIHVGDRVAGEKSCSYCDCEDGWAGVDCGRCTSVSACPDITVNGTLVSATNCSSSSLIPTGEESRLENGKVFSCSCGGGVDGWTASLCGFQPDTWVEFTMKGPGTADSPAVMTFTEFAGTETTLEEAWPGEHDFFYPVIFEGTATGCTVTRGSCLAVEGTDLGEKECVRFDCQNTQGDCPPAGYPECDGFPECEDDEGQAYQLHRCYGAPALGKSLTIACEDNQVNGTYVCWYQQPGEFAPLSMTCSVGSCLYEDTTVVEIDTVVAETTPLDVAEQSIVLVAGALFLMLLFFLFALASDWGSARSASKSCCFSKKLGSAAVGGGGAAGHKNASGVAGVGFDAPSTPAVLEWKNLSYSVAVSARSASAGGGGGGIFGFLAAGCRSPELSVLSRVSGFAGPAEGHHADSAYPVAATLSAKSSLSVSSNPSAAAEEEKAVDVDDGGAPVVSGQEPEPAPAAAAATAEEAAGSTTDAIPSTVTGILGPSGAGKSSLLDILAGRKRSGEGSATGQISLTAAGAGGGGRARGPAEIRRVAGYVPQEDVLPGTLSCYEHLMFHARLRMPRSATHAERRARALLVLDELGLSRVADSRVGDERRRGLSGGEKRRLSIAAELMARPPLLFADEPTTGLDAATALRVMTLLKGVASRGTTVVCSLHQPRPRVLNLLDNVMLLSGGQVAYFGRPEDSESYFTSVGRPFPQEQPHPADAMLGLCCREDGSALPALFERCPLVEDGVYGGTPGAGPAGGGGSGATSRQSLCRDSSGSSGYLRNPSAGKDVEAQTVAAAAAAAAAAACAEQQAEDGEGGEGDGEGWTPWFCCGSAGRGGGGGAGAKRPPTAGLLVQTEALSRRLLLRAVRHPLLLVLHFGGSVAMAACLGTVFQGKLDFSFEGAQSRLGVLFFLLLYLSLLSLTSLPVWREDRRLFLSESMGGAYGHLPYFTSVALADVLLVRVVPPLAFAVVAYPLMGLNDFPDGKWTLFWFALILVLANVSVALAAMGIGALGLPLDLANLVGGSMVLIFSLFSRFLLNDSRISDTWQWLSDVTPLGYAYESLLVNEFNDPLGSRPYTIDGGQCSPELPVIKPLGSTILQTFEFDPLLDRMYENVRSLALIALVFGALSFLIFYIFTRTSPLSLRKPVSTKRRTTSLPQSSLFSNNNPIYTNNQHADNLNPHAPVAAREESTVAPAAASGGTENLATPVSGSGATAAAPTAAAGNVSSSLKTTATAKGVVAGGDASSVAVGSPAGLLLSWEDIWLSVPKPGGRRALRRRHRDGGLDERHLSTGRLAVLTGVSGFAGPSAVAPEAAEKGVGGGGSGGGGGSVTAIMGPSGAGKTTLLNVLAGRHRGGCGGCGGGCGGGGGGAVAGAVRLNGTEVGAADVRAVSGYVTQEDVLPETLTCFEHLMFHAELRMGKAGGGGGGGARRRLGKEDRKKRVLEVLRDLRLEGVRDSRIGGGLSRGISGGEKRRLSIATELLTCPGLLFADEPTTGLDSSTALTTMQLLSSIASSRGTTVVCSLHQPRPQVYDSLDRVLLMSRGVVSFFGPPSSTAAHFVSVGRPLGGNGGGGLADEDASGGGGVGLADAMLDVVGDAEMAVDGERSERQDGQMATSQLVVMPREELLAEVRRAESVAPPPPSRQELKLLGWTPPVVTQLRALSGRALRDVARDPYLATLHVVLTPLMGLLVGTLFGDLRRDNSETAGIQGRLGALFFFLLVLAFLCLTSLASWVRQMALFRHERESGAYGAFSHLVTSFLADALVCRVVPPVLLAATVRPLAGLRYGSLAGLCGGLVVFNVATAAVLSACGAGAKSGQEALAMGCLFVLFSALLSGYLVARDDLPSVWGGLVWVSPFAHAFEALVVNEFSEYGAVFRLSTVISGFTAYSPWLTGDNILSCFGFDNGRFGADLGLLVAIGAAGLLLAYALLKRA